jgi:hypothetical protein
MEKIGMKARRAGQPDQEEEKDGLDDRFYARLIRFSKRFKWAFIMFFLSWVRDTRAVASLTKWRKKANGRIFTTRPGSSWFTEEARPVLEKVLGDRCGSFRICFLRVRFTRSLREPCST